ncbi:MAG: hypothetical protein H6733_16245 [Alphaproteobacteria bacterium]|nr:hypothetical protein [Alphaproteobacteria bacterium]
MIVMWLWTAALAAPPTLGPDDVAPSACQWRAVAGTVTAAPLGEPAPDLGDACLGGVLDVAGRGTLAFPDVGLSRRVELARGRMQLAVDVGTIRARVAFVATRSAAPTGYLGIDGEAIVPKLQIAEARVDLPVAGLAASAGVVDDLWTISAQDRWGLRYVARTLGDDRGWMFRSDLGGWVSWTGPRGVASLSASLTTGEGADLRERNEGKDVAGLLVVHPLAFTARPILLEVALYGREASRGVERSRDHRIGARVDVAERRVGAGVETLVGWGLDGDPSVLPAGVSAWARTGPALPLVGWARVDLGWGDRRDADTLTTSWRVGVGPMLPWRARAIPAAFHVLVGYEGAALGANARPVAGASAGAVTHEVFLQIGARVDVRGRVALAAGSEPPQSLERMP